MAEAPVGSGNSGYTSSVFIAGVRVGVPVASVQETSIRTSTGNAVEENENYFPHLLWTNTTDFLVV
jgi:hypothetical protein